MMPYGHWVDNHLYSSGTVATLGRAKLLQVISAQLILISIL